MGGRLRGLGFVVVLVCALLAASSAGAGARVPSPVPPGPGPGPSGHDQCVTSVIIAILAPKGSRIASQRSIPFCLSGAITTQFHGSRTAGCARIGVCRYSGSVTYRPEGGVLLSYAIVRDGHRTRETATGLDGVRPSVVVTRTVAGHVRGTCRDRGVAVPNGIEQLPVRRGLARIGLPRGGTNVWSERCAGPVRADLPPTPAIRLPLAAILHGAASTTASGTREFEHGGWAGTVTEHLSISAGPPDRTGGGHGVRPPPHKPKPERVVSVTFRVSPPAGAVALRWSHPVIGCSILDACGLRGTARIQAQGAHASTITISAYGSPDRPRRDFLTALGLASGGDTHGITALGLERPYQPIQLRSTTEQDGARCRGTGGGSVALILIDSHRGFLLGEAAGLAGPDSLRTACPGPALGPRVLALARVPQAGLASRHTTLRLTQPRHFVNGGYEVQVRPHLTISSTRTRISDHLVAFAAAGTRRVDRCPDKRPISAVCADLYTGRLPPTLRAASQ